MATVKNQQAGANQPVQIKDVSITANINKHFVTGPRETDKLRNRVLMYIKKSENLSEWLFLDNGETLTGTEDLLLIPIVQLELKYWL